MINTSSPNLANVRDPKAENATDDIDRSVWLTPADQVDNEIGCRKTTKAMWG